MTAHHFSWEAERMWISMLIFSISSRFWGPAKHCMLMTQMEMHPERLKRRRSYFLRLFTPAGAIGSILFVLVFTIDGFLRPGYSPIHQVVSDLGIGRNAWILNTDLVVFGLLFMLFAIGFYQAMLKLIGGRELISRTFLLLLTWAGGMNH